jgi:hypothetical protein
MDREKDDQQTLVFTVWAKDGGSPACMTSQRVQLDVFGANENVPEVCYLTVSQQPVCGGNISITAVTGAKEGRGVFCLQVLG